MNNYKEEIEKLQTQLDELKSKIEKPKFEVGKWYKSTNDKALYYIEEFNGFEKYGRNYGFNYNGEWMDSEKRFFNDGNAIESTPKEVEDALIKEAVKRGFKEGVKFKTITDNTYTAKGRIEIYKSPYTFGLTFSCSHGLIFENGKWAEIVKAKTIEEIAREFSIFQINYPDNSTYKDFKDFCIENKQDIINALNNL